MGMVADEGTYRDIETMTPAGEYGGYQYTAEYLTALSGEHYSRQGVYGLWFRGRQGRNSFPDQKLYVVNGKSKLYFDLDDVKDWYYRERISQGTV